MELSPNIEMRKLSRESKEFFDKVLFDEEPIFVSDEATIWDVSTSTAEDLLKRCAQHYGKTLTVEDLNQPLWKLLRELNTSK